MMRDSFRCRLNAGLTHCGNREKAVGGIFHIAAAPRAYFAVALLTKELVGMLHGRSADKIWTELMLHQQAQQQEYQTLGIPILPDGYVFAMPFGTCVEPSTMRDALNYLLAAAGIEHANFHSLRHTFATRAIEAGIPVKTLSDILGHSQVQITMDLYCHSSLDHMRDSMNALMGMF